MKSLAPRVFACIGLLPLVLPPAAFGDVPLLRQEQNAREVARAALRSLSDAQLMQEYDDPGCLVSLDPYSILGTLYPATQQGRNSPAASAALSKYLLFCDIEGEIVRRGAPMAAPLAGFLTATLPKKRLAPTPPTSGIGWWYDTQTISLLAQIRDPRSAQALLAVLTGDGRKPASEEGYAAERALEALTCCCFYLNPAGDSLAVPRVGASRLCPDNRQDRDFEEAAAFYRVWLAGEGKDAAQWLPLARRRARALLAADDPVGINAAALFLTARDGGGPHDDAPEQTRTRLAEIAAQVRLERTDVADGGYPRRIVSYKGRPLPEEAGPLSWFSECIDSQAQR